MARLDLRRLEGKKAVVTGAARGLGEAIAERLATEGCDCALWDIAPAVRQTAERVAGKTGRDCFGVVCDITKEDDVVRAFSEVRSRLGRLDVIVCNAGVVKAYDITEFPVDEWRWVIDVNLVGYMICAKHAALWMVERGEGGSIIQINSKSGKKGSFRNSAYAASKFGGIGLTQSIALDLAPHKIRVNAVCPGNLLDSPLWVESLYEQYARKWGITVEEVRAKYESQVPLGRGCSYDDVTNVVVFLASDESDYMTGQAINVTGGQEMR